MIDTVVYYQNTWNFDPSDPGRLPSHFINYDYWMLPSLRHFCKTNPNIKVYLLSNDIYKNEPFESILIDDINQSRINVFRENYAHMSSNPMLFERSAIERWLVLSDFINSLNRDFSSILHLETDVLVYESVENWDDLVSDYDFTLTRGQAGGCSIVNKMEFFEDFCTFIEGIYVGRDRFFKNLKLTYDRMTEKNLRGGICDMTLLSWFFMNSDYKPLKHLEKLVIEDKVFDSHIRDITDWEPETFCKTCPGIESTHPPISSDFTVKKFNMKNEIPYCHNNVTNQDLAHRLIHFIGNTKFLIPDYIPDHG